MQHYPFYLLVSLFLLQGCRATEKTAVSESKPAGCLLSPELSKLITTDTLTQSEIAGELELTGNVSYDQNRLYRYQSLVSGVVQQVRFNIGDYVRKGQPLMEIKTADMSDQKLNLKQAELNLRLAQRQLTATSALHRDGIASDRELLEAENEVAAAQNEIGKLHEVIRLQGGDVQRGLVTVTAPATGYIVSKKVTGGYQVDSGEDELFVISDLRRIWVMVNVYAAQLQAVQPGTEVAIRTTAYPDRTFHGKVSRLSNVFDPEEKVMKAVVELENADLALKPDMMVSIKIREKKQEKAVAIPARAVIFDNGAYHLVRHEGDCRVASVTFSPVARNGSYFYTRDQTLQPGQKIVTRNSLLLFNELKKR